MAVSSSRPAYTYGDREYESFRSAPPDGGRGPSPSAGMDAAARRRASPDRLPPASVHAPSALPSHQTGDAKWKQLRSAAKTIELAAVQRELPLYGDADCPPLPSDPTRTGYNVIPRSPARAPPAVRGYALGGMHDADGSPYGARYAGDDATQTVERESTIPLPDVLYDQYLMLECRCFMGLFPEINRAWVTIDNRLFLWDYTASQGKPSASAAAAGAADDNLVTYDGQKQIIISVALVKPVAGVFLPQIEFLLVVTTPIEIILLGVTFEGPERRELAIIETGLAQSSDQILMGAIVSTAEGRVFMCGNNGHLFELEYRASAGLFSSRMNRINRTASSLAYFLPSFLHFGPDDGALSLAIDPHRHILYVLTAQNNIQVVDLGHDGKGYTVVAKQTDLQRHLLEALDQNYRSTALHLLDAQRFFIIALHVVAPAESDTVHLVAVASNGCRLYLTTAADRAAQLGRLPYGSALQSAYGSRSSWSGPSSLTARSAAAAPSSSSGSSGSSGSSARPTGLYLVAVRPPPPDPTGGSAAAAALAAHQNAAGSESSVLPSLHVSFYRQGLFLAGNSLSDDADALVSVGLDAGVMSRMAHFAEAASSQVVECKVWAIAEAPLPPSSLAALQADAIASVAAASTSASASASASASKSQRATVPWGHYLMAPSRRFPLLTNAGVVFYREVRPIDHLVTLLEQACLMGAAPGAHVQQAIATFVGHYGNMAACAMCLAVACGDPQAQRGGAVNLGGDDGSLSPAVRDLAARLFFQYGGQPCYMGGAYAVQDAYPPPLQGLGRPVPKAEVRYSHKHDAFAHYVARLVHPIWRARLVRPIAGTKDYDLAYATRLLVAIRAQLEELSHFLLRHPVFISDAGFASAAVVNGDPSGLYGPTSLDPASLEASQQEGISLASMRTLLMYAIQGTHFLLLLADHQLPAVIRRLKPELRAQLASLSLEALLTTPQGNHLARELGRALVQREIDAGVAVEHVAQSLRRACGAFCTATDLLAFRAAQSLAAVSRAETRADANAQLQEALDLYLQILTPAAHRADGAMTAHHRRLGYDEYDHAADRRHGYGDAAGASHGYAPHGTHSRGMAMTAGGRPHPEHGYHHGDGLSSEGAEYGHDSPVLSVDRIEEVMFKFNEHQCFRGAIEICLAYAAHTSDPSQAAAPANLSADLADAGPMVPPRESTWTPEEKSAYGLICKTLSQAIAANGPSDVQQMLASFLTRYPMRGAFHVTVFWFLKGQGLTDWLLTLPSPWLPSWLYEQRFQEGYVELLTRVLMAKHRFTKAATFLLEMAESRAELPLQLRLEYLFRATANLKSIDETSRDAGGPRGANSSTAHGDDVPYENAGHRAGLGMGGPVTSNSGSMTDFHGRPIHLGELVSDIADKTDVALVQMQVLNSLPTAVSPASLPSEDGQPATEAVQAAEAQLAQCRVQLETRLLSLTELYQICENYEMHEHLLAIFHTSDHRDHAQIAVIWERLIGATLANAMLGGGNALDAIRDQLVAMADRYGVNTAIVPVTMLFPHLATLLTEQPGDVEALLRHSQPTLRHGKEVERPVRVRNDLTETAGCPPLAAAAAWLVETFVSGMGVSARTVLGLLTPLTDPHPTRSLGAAGLRLHAPPAGSSGSASAARATLVARFAWEAILYVVDQGVFGHVSAKHHPEAWRTLLLPQGQDAMTALADAPDGADGNPFLDAAEAMDDDDDEDTRGAYAGLAATTSPLQALVQLEDLLRRGVSQLADLASLSVSPAARSPFTDDAADAELSTTRHASLGRRLAKLWNEVKQRYELDATAMAEKHAASSASASSTFMTPRVMRGGAGARPTTDRPAAAYEDAANLRDDLRLGTGGMATASGFYGAGSGAQPSYARDGASKPSLYHSAAYPAASGSAATPLTRLSAQRTSPRFH